MNLSIDFDPGGLYAHGHYTVAVRDASVLWMPASIGIQDWQKARATWAMFGDRDHPWPPLPPGQPEHFNSSFLLKGYRSMALICSTKEKRGHPPPGPDHCEDDFRLSPLRSSPGPDMLIVRTHVIWPDQREESGASVSMRFGVELPDGDSLAERITAALGPEPRRLPPVGPELDDYEHLQ